MLLVINTPIRHHAPEVKLPKTHQLLLGLADGSHLSCMMQMWGGDVLLPLR